MIDSDEGEHYFSPYYEEEKEEYSDYWEDYELEDWE